LFWEQVLGLLVWQFMQKASDLALLLRAGALAAPMKL
jgi:hypothetical protein